MPLTAKTIKDLRDDKYDTHGLTFVRAIDVVVRSPLTVCQSTRNDEPLYALPGGGRATRGEIFKLLSQ